MAWNLSRAGVFLLSASPKAGSLSTLHCCCCCCPAIHTNPTGTSSTTTRYTHYLDLPSRTEINVRRETITARSMPPQCSFCCARSRNRADSTCDLVSRASRIFPGLHMRARKWEGEEKGKNYVCRYGMQ